MSRQDTYTHGHHESVLRSHQWRTAANSAAYLLAHLRPGMRVLDIGCGPGTITLDLAGAVSPGRVVGLDVVPEPLAAARANAEARGDTVTRFAVGDVYALDVPDAAFDVVHAHQVLQHLSDPVAALREMRRVCAPGGVVAARDADYAAMVWHPADVRLDRWLEVYKAVARGNAAEPDAARHLLAWAHTAGLADVTCSASTWCFASPDERAWWGGLWADRVTRSALATQALERGPGVAGGPRRAGPGVAGLGGAPRRVVRRGARRDPGARLVPRPEPRFRWGFIRAPYRAPDSPPVGV